VNGIASAALVTCIFDDPWFVRLVLCVRALQCGGEVRTSGEQKPAGSENG